MRIQNRHSVNRRFQRTPYSKALQIKFAPTVRLNAQLIADLTRSAQRPIQTSFWDPASCWIGPQVTLKSLEASVFEGPVW